MTGLVSKWVLGITAAAFLNALAMAVTPEGKVRRVTQLAGTLLGIVVLLGPVAELDMTELAVEMADYSAESSALAGELEAANARLQKTLIEQDCEEYISDKGRELGLTLEVEVTARLDSDGYYYPYAVHLTNLSGGDAQTMRRVIEESFGIPEERQYWNDGDF